MAVMTTMAIVGVAIKAIGSTIELYKKKTPSWQQKEEKHLFNKFDYLSDIYELEKRKPRYDETKSAKENQNARSEDRLLNSRDALLRFGETLCERLRSTES